MLGVTSRPGATKSWISHVRRTTVWVTARTSRARPRRTTMTNATIDPAHDRTDLDLPLDELARQVAGPVYAGDDPRAPDEVATFNLAMVHRPAVVVGATNAQDVA